MGPGTLRARLLGQTQASNWGQLVCVEEAGANGFIKAQTLLSV